METEEDVQETEPAKKKSSLKLILIILIVLLVIGAAAGAGIYFFSRTKQAPATEGVTKEAATKAEKAPAPLVGALWSLDPFIVNLADNRGERYLKVVMQLELSEASVAAELDILRPKIRDNILDLLTVKTYAELMEPTGKQRLREEIMLRINSFLTKGNVVTVYFTEFVIQ
jgi:flagellar FliL protein